MKRSYDNNTPLSLPFVERASMQFSDDLQPLTAFQDCAKAFKLRTQSDVNSLVLDHCYQWWCSYSQVCMATHPTTIGESPPGDTCINHRRNRQLVVNDIVQCITLAICSLELSSCLLRLYPASAAVGWQSQLTRWHTGPCHATPSRSQNNTWR